MSSSSSSSLSPFAIIQEYLTRYGMTTYVILGDIGLVLNIIIFSQPTHRRNSCSLYILLMSLCSMIALNIAIIPIIYALDHLNPMSYSMVFCQLQFYFRHSFNQMMRTFFVLACVDRYAISSNNRSIRLFSRYQVAIRLIPSVILFWLLLSIFPTMSYSIVNDICDVISGLCDVLYSIYILIVIGVFPLVSMITFELLMIINLKKIRARVHPIGNIGTTKNILLKRDRDMMRMLLIELTTYTCTTIPYTLVLLYKVISSTTKKNNERQQIESFVFYLARLFALYLHNSSSFWIYLSTSRSFRIELKCLLIKWFNNITRLQLQINRTN